jgi:tetratricopeptide (TPR) repeat protein
MEEALNNLRRALAIESEYLPAFDQMALLYLEQARRQDDDVQMLDLAEVVCRQAQLIDREHAPIYNTWGLIKVRRGDIIEALRMFERAMELDRSMFEAFMNFGQITLSFRGYEDARNAFARAVELRPADYDAHIGLGAAHRGLGLLAEAEAEYRRAGEIDAARPEAHFNLGVLRQDYAAPRADDPEPDLREAVSHFGEFLTRARNRPELAGAIAEVERRCQEPDGSRRRRRRTTDCRPGRLQLIEQMQRDLREVREIQAVEQRGQPPP